MLPWSTKTATIEQLCATPRIIPTGIWHFVCDQLGVPTRLALVVRGSEIASAPIHPPPRVACADHIVQWHRFGEGEPARTANKARVMRCWHSTDSVSVRRTAPPAHA